MTFRALSVGFGIPEEEEGCGCVHDKISCQTSLCCSMGATRGGCLTGGYGLTVWWGVYCFVGGSSCDKEVVGPLVGVAT